MNTNSVTVRNTKTGRVGVVPRRYLESDVLNKGRLVEVESNAKPYIPELYRPRTADEFLASKRITEPAIDPAAVESFEDDAEHDDTKDSE